MSRETLSLHPIEEEPNPFDQFAGPKDTPEKKAARLAKNHEFVRRILAESKVVPLERKPS